MTLRYNPKTMEWEGITGGVDLSRLARRAEEIEKAKKSAIGENPKYDFARWASEYIAQQMEIQMAPVGFSNKRACCYYPFRKQVVYSYRNLEKEAGFTEYSSVGKIWIEQGHYGQYIKFDGRIGFWKFEQMSGLKRIWAIVVHEMAHAYQCDKDGRSDKHGDRFKKCLKELIVLFPFGEVLEAYAKASKQSVELLNKI